MKIDILIAIMAVQEAHFFAPIARRLMAESGLDIAFLTFHEAADDILDAEGIKYFSIHKLKRASGANSDRTDIEEIEKKLGIPLDSLTVHERLTTNRHDRAYLKTKVSTYSEIIERILTENKIGCVLQELGGFIAPQLLYRIARMHNIKHVFIEPAMFPKRVVFTLNDLYADIPGYNAGAEAKSNRDLEMLLNQYVGEKTVVIPKKDKHFFRDMTLGRLLSPDNFKRLGRKLYHKYILGREEEYSAIGWYVVYHVIKMFRRKVMTFYYSDPVAGDKYIYYPFHVPLDVQLTIRCPEFLEQEAVVERIAGALPEGYKLYVKEHPAAIGGHSLEKMKGMLRRCPNVRLLHPRYNSFDIIKAADAVITVNSKVGVEAIMQGKPVIVLGKTFYRGKGVTVDVEGPENLASSISAALNGASAVGKSKMVFLSQAFGWTMKGELYENSLENMDSFYLSLKSFLFESGAASRSGTSAEKEVAV